MTRVTVYSDGNPSYEWDIYKEQKSVKDSIGEQLYRLRYLRQTGQIASNQVIDDVIRVLESVGSKEQ